MKWLEKNSFEAFNKGSNEEDSDKEYNRDEESDDECKTGKDCPSGLMSIEQIQSLRANGINAQLGGGSHKTNLCAKPCTKRINALRMPHGY